MTASVCECIVSQWNILVSVLYFLLYEKQKQNVVENAFVFVETLRVWSRHESFYDEKAFTQSKKDTTRPIRIDRPLRFFQSSNNIWNNIATTYFRQPLKCPCCHAETDRSYPETRIMTLWKCCYICCWFQFLIYIYIHIYTSNDNCCRCCHHRLRRFCCCCFVMLWILDKIVHVQLLVRLWNIHNIRSKLLRVEIFIER